MKLPYLLGLLLSGLFANTADKVSGGEVIESVAPEEALPKDENKDNKRRAIGEVSNNQEVKDNQTENKIFNQDLENELTLNIPKELEKTNTDHELKQPDGWTSLDQSEGGRAPEWLKNNGSDNEHENSTESAGDRIVGGSEARPHEFPFMAALRKHGRLFCGGSLLDRRHVLTAAHCVVRIRKSDLKHISVSLGDHNIKTSSEANNVVVGVKTIIRHRAFSGSHMDADVAVLTLSRPVDFSTTIQPVGLAAGEEDFTGQTATASGWGSLSSGGSLPSRLRKVNLKVLSLSTCRDKLSSSSSPITRNMICAANRGRDTCQGDSGGPLFTCSGKDCTQIGITSWGFGCANPRFPGVYARVSTLEPWIRRIVDKY